MVARDILLENLTGLSIRLTLWNNLAWEFDDSMLQNGDTNHVVVITSTTVEVFQGNEDIINSTFIFVKEKKTNNVGDYRRNLSAIQ